ncbi:hypothetical protein ABID65_007564 [Bradyrhizobium sp. S3.9.2]|uniref:hypothetical protein n=1 Tax=Bradyrhizobium sp. S3.9.2 TaxID=3156432 RepID=UPI0033927CE4
MAIKVVRVIPHEESIEVRVSTFIYFDDNPGRRSTNDAVEEAKRVARKHKMAKIVSIGTRGS